MERTYRFESTRLTINGRNVLLRFVCCCESLSLEEFLQRDSSMWRREMEATAARPMQIVYACRQCGATRKVGAA